MRQEYEPQDLIKERSHPLDLRPNGSVSQAQHIALVPLLYLKRVFFPVWMVVLSRVRRWWHHPIVGYLIALLSQAIAVSIVLLLIHVFPDFAILGLLLILATLVVSLGWGAGPSLFAALVSTALFNYFLLSPQFTWSFQNPQQVTETSIFLLVGITISLLASRAKRARLEAKANRSRLENLVAQLQGEQEALRQAKKEADAQAHQLEAVFEAVTDVLVVLDVNEQVTFTNAAFRTLVAGDATSGYFSQSLQDHGKWFVPQDEQGNSLPKEHWPITRVLKGEVLTGANTVDVSVNTPDGQTLYLNMGGAPIHNGNGQISGTVMVARDVTQRRQLERQMQETLLALRKSEARFRRLFDANILGIHFANVNGTVTESNDTFLQMVGFTHKEVQEGSLRWNEITSAEYREADKQAIAQLRATGVCAPFEKEYLRRDGIRVSILVGIALLEGSEEDVIAYTLDLTERKRLEAALRRVQRETAESASELEAIFDTITDQVLVYNRESQLIRSNEAARSFNRLLSQSVYLSRPAQVRFEPYVIRNQQGETFSLDQLPISRILRGEVLSSTNAEDIWLTLPDGREVLLNVTGAPIYDDQRQLIGGVMICRNVTERRRLEQRTQDVLEALLTMAHVMVQGDPLARASTDQPSQAMRVIAQQFAQLTRRVLGCKRLSIMTVEQGSDILRPVAVVGISAEQEREWWAEQEQRPGHLSDGPDPELSVRLHAKDLVVLDMSKSPFDSHPNPYGIRTMLIAPLHIGEQLVGLLFMDHGGVDHIYTQQELQLTKAVAELAALVIERERLLHERAQAEANALGAQESTRLMDAFIGIAGHELRTPLTAIKGNIQLASRHVTRMLQPESTLSADLTKQLAMIQGLLERAERQAGVQNRLVRDLVEVSRIHSDHLELRMELCDLVSIVRQGISDQRLMNPARTIGLTVEVPQLLVRADMDRVEQVIHNYVSNALKYSESTEPVEVSVTQEGTNGLVLVRDQGPGLTQDQQEHIWERFQRVEGVKVKSGSSVGLGLGLHISQTVIERHGGHVGVESVVDKGSTFWFTLPLADSMSEATEE